MREAQPSPIFLDDYLPPSFLVDNVYLEFLLNEDYTRVNSTLSIRKNSVAENSQDIFLNGEELELEDILINGEVLKEAQYQIQEKGLSIFCVPDEFELTISVKINPQLNTRLEGLYKSKKMFCTQCEAEGFRRITYYPDRPDILAKFEVIIDADEQRYPVLLSNGDLKAEHSEAGRKRVTWIDPHPKPSYLFALVAGDLSCVVDQFVTFRNRMVDLRIYVEERDLDKCTHAMSSLKKAMRWDEKMFGREYDLDIFNIVAVDDFNMGAMENKSLNIFNTACVLASAETTTDLGFQRVESIVAHEYFHNWSGNRVTCRDWFQLSLKEGFTVYRDAEFSSDMGSRSVKRIEDTMTMRTAQFAEDAGPMAHPVRPASYIEISNFYTLTVYEKGAEVVRMMRVLLGEQLFREGTDLYFDRHDGQAVTCEEFVVAMEDVSGIDLNQFRLWYSQAGTPVLTINDSYNESDRTYRLSIRQDCPSTPGQDQKKPFVIPLAMGLLGESGNLSLTLANNPTELNMDSHRVLVIDEEVQEYVFTNVEEKPIPSLLRGFSAPVRLNYNYSRFDLCALISRDEDEFVRWDASQQLAIQIINEVELAMQQDLPVSIDPIILEAWRNLLKDDTLDPAIIAAMVRLPGEVYLGELASQKSGINVDSIRKSRELVRRYLAQALEEEWLSTYEKFRVHQAYEASGSQIAHRSLSNISLEFLSCKGELGIELATVQLAESDNMTDRLSALRVLAFEGNESKREQALDSFYRTWKNETLVVNQWLQVQASIPDNTCLDRIEKLICHEAFDLRNPNKVRSLIGCYAQNNPTQFHRIDGAGYKFLIEKIFELNNLNPQIAARLLAPLTKWKHYLGREQLIKEQLENLANTENLSKDVFEVVSKSLE